MGQVAGPYGGAAFLDAHVDADLDLMPFQMCRDGCLVVPLDGYTVARDLPPGAAVLVMTHDHAEDLAVLDVCLRRDDLVFLGLIGSASKWRTFQGRLAALGHDEATVARVTSPVGLPGVPGKSPAAIAVAVAAQLLTVLDLPEASTS